MMWDLITVTAIVIEGSEGLSLCVCVGGGGSDEALILAAVLQHLPPLQEAINL